MLEVLPAKPSPGTEYIVQIVVFAFRCIYVQLYTSIYNKPSYVNTHLYDEYPQQRGGGVKSVSRCDCEYQVGKLLRVVSQLRPRIRPQYTQG
jgi:hypothetical protein